MPKTTTPKDPTFLGGRNIAGKPPRNPKPSRTTQRPQEQTEEPEPDDIDNTDSE